MAITTKPIPELTDKQKKRFWSRVKIGEPDACWEWQAAKNKKGYGNATIKRKPFRSHRIAWALTNGPIFGNILVLHKCDNPPCTNPAHLFLGTHDDNMNDMAYKDRAAKGEKNGQYTHPESRTYGDNNGTRLHPGRLARGPNNGKYTHPEKTPRGENNGMAKLTTEIVLEIRGLKKLKWPQRKIANHLKVSESTISHIILNKTWRHVTVPPA